MGRKLGIGLAVVVVVLAGAYFGLTAYASRQAAKQVDAAIARLGPQLTATYAKVDFDILTRETAVRDVTFTVAGEPPVRVREVLIKRVDMHSPNPAYADLEVRGVAIDPKTVGDTGTLTALGYTGPILCDWGISYTYAKDRRELDLHKLSVTVKDAGSLTLAMRLGNLELPADERQMQKFLLTGLPRVVLRDASVTYKDASLVDRALRLEAKQKGISVEQLRQELFKQADSLLGLPEGKSPLVAGAVAAIKRFLAKPESLSVTAKPAAPTSLGELGNTTSPDEVAKLLNLQFTS